MELRTSARPETGHRHNIAQFHHVASFLGGAAADRGSFGLFGWTALAMLVLGLLLAVVILAPWRLTFSLNAWEFYEDLRRDADQDPLEWLVAGALAYERAMNANGPTVTLLARCSAALSVIAVVETILWIGAVGVR